MYLEKEILKLRIALEKETNKDIRKILLEQKKHLENMRSITGNLFMKYADDEGRLIVNGVDRFNIMKEMEKNIINMSRDLIDTTTKITDETLLKSYVDSYYKTANIIDKGSSVGINYKILRPEFIESVLKVNFESVTYSDRIWKNTNKLADKLYDVIGKGISDGTSVRKLSKEIKDTFGTSSFESQRLVRNELSRVVSSAQDQIYQDNSDIINELLFIATLDDRTSETCQGLDGNRYLLTDSYPKIPEDTHIMCRSCYVPVVEGWSPKTRRDNITKENIPYTDYKSWKKDNKSS